MNLKIMSGALEESEGNTIILRGAVDLSSLDGLLIGTYQREEMASTIEKLLKLFCGRKRVPDIDLAVRGEQFGCVEDKKRTFTVTGDVYVVDGQQRISAAKRCIREGGAPRLGAMVHFGTTEDWERERFIGLNLNQRRASANVVLRDTAPKNPALQRLYDLCSDDSFALYERVSWRQFMRREDLLTATTFLRITMRLHDRFGAGRHSSVPNMCDALVPMAASIGLATMANNTKDFFGLLDEAWGIRGILHKDRATHLGYGFLAALTDVLTEHDVFWNGKVLRIDRDLRKKISQFPIKEQNIDAMARSSNSATITLLRRLIVDHINSNKRTRRLRKTTRGAEGGTRVAV